jgi:septum formation protein
MISATLILASGSPRRAELLAQIGVTPDRVVIPAIDESPKRDELPRDYARRMAREKAHAVAALHPEARVLAADTVVTCGRRILDQTQEEAIARAHLQLLSGRRHQVHTAVALAMPGSKLQERYVMTRVAMKRLHAQELDAYLASGEWKGKAGAYAIQGLAGGFITWINGSYSAVVGLPLAETRALLGG